MNEFGMMQVGMGDDFHAGAAASRSPVSGLENSDMES